MFGGATLGGDADAFAGGSGKCGNLSGAMKLVLTGDSVTFENRWEVSGGLSMGVASGALMSSEALMSEGGVGD